MYGEDLICLSKEFLIAQAILGLKRQQKPKKEISPELKAARAQKAKERKERITLENLEQAKIINRHRQDAMDRGLKVDCEPVPVKPMSKHKRKHYVVMDMLDRLPSGYKRAAIKARATPEWADKDKIDEIYAERDKLNKQEIDDPYEVDHIYPILGKTVCGLHVEANLRLLRKSENIAKSNKHPDNP